MDTVRQVVVGDGRVLGSVGGVHSVSGLLLLSPRLVTLQSWPTTGPVLESENVVCGHGT